MVDQTHVRVPLNALHACWEVVAASLLFMNTIDSGFGVCHVEITDSCPSVVQRFVALRAQGRISDVGLR